MTALQTERAAPTGAVSRTGVPAWVGVLSSRLLVLGVGWLTALLAPRVRLWWLFDPARISARQGAVGNVLSGPLVRWDSVHYLEIAQHGYAQANNTPFYPLYPLLIHALSWITGSAILAGFLVSACAFSVGLLLLHRLAAQELGERVARSTVLLLATAPLSFFFTAVYTESLFLVLLVATFLLARRDRFGWAGVTAAAATLTHVEGILLVAPLALMVWRTRSSAPRARDTAWRVGALALPPAALAGFLVYLHSLGFGWLAPVQNANTSSYERSMVGTPVMLWRALSTGLSGLWQTLHGVAPVEPSVGGPFTLGFQNLVYLVILVIALACLVVVWRRLPPEYGVFSTLSLLVMTSSAVMERPLLSFDRYTLTVFPLWIAAAWSLERRRLMRPVVIVSCGLLVFYVIEFTRWVFVA